MELFKITCVTCGARLSVRNAALVGQILGCPRCGSMVQVAAPAGAAPPSLRPAGALVDEPAGAQVAHDLAAAASPATASVAAPSAAAPARAAQATATFDDVGELGQAPPAETTGAETKLPGARPPAAMSTVKLAALAAGSAIVCSAMAAGVLSWLASSPPQPAQGAPAAVAATAPASGAPGSPEALGVGTPPSAAPPAGSPAPPPGADALTAAAPAASAPAADQVLPPAQPLAAVAADASPDEPEAAPGAGAPVVPPPPAGGATVAAPPPPDAGPAPAKAPGGDPITAAAASAPRLRIDPLEVDPEGLDLSMLVSGDAGDAAALSELPGEAAPARESVGASSPEGEPAAQPADLPQEEPAAPPAAAEVLLARRYPAIHIEKMPLGRFLHFATALSAVPVSASPQELRLAAASAATAVSVEAADATIAELLAAALKPARLVPMVEDSHIVLRRAGEDRERELKIPIDDLVDAAGGPTAETIADWVPALVAPAAWQRAGGPGSVVVDGPALHVRQSERVGFETVLLLERYRVARGLPPRSKYPQKLLGALVHTERLLERLAAPATFTFSRPTPLAEVFAYWQQELGVAVLVDWPALAEVRLAPHSRTSVSAAAASWGAGLTAALAPLELDWRIVDGRTIEITSAEKVRSEPQLGIYMLKALPASAGDRSASNAAAADQATMQAHVQKLVAQQGASAGVAFDGAHGVLMVLAPAADQRRLVGWLGAEGFLAAERAAGE